MFKKLLLSLVFFPLFSVGNTGSEGKCRKVFSSFLKENYNEESMKDHLRLIKERDYPTEVSKSLLQLFDQNIDVGLRGMIGRVLGENRLARNNKKKIVSIMIQTLNDKSKHYLERKGMAQGLGYLLKSTDGKEIRELAKALKDTSSAVKKEVALSLGRINPKNEKDIEQELIEIATNPNEKDFVREASISVLGEIISPEDFKTHWKLYELLSDDNSKIRKSAQLALTKIDSNVYTIVQSIKIQELYQKHIDQEDKKYYNAPQPFGSWFTVRVFLAIHKRGYFVIPEFEFVADKTVTHASGKRPYRIDLVVIGHDQKKLAIECDGNQHEYKENKENDKKRVNELRSFGWEFHRIRQKDFYSQPDQVLERLWKRLDEMKIKPFSKEKKSFWPWSKKKS